MNKQKDKVNIIVELKYDYDADNNANSITNILPFRISKNSKYIAMTLRLAQTRGLIRLRSISINVAQWFSMPC